MRHVLFMDEGEGAAGGIPREHQVPVRMPLSVATSGQAGWEVQAPGPRHSLLWPGPPTWTVLEGLQGGTGRGSRLQTSEPWSWGTLTSPQSTEKGACFPLTHEVRRARSHQARPRPSLHHRHPSHRADE